MVGCCGEEIEGEVKSTISNWWLPNSIVIASTDAVNGGVVTDVHLCSPGLSSDIFTTLVKNLSPSNDGDCLVQIGLVLWRI